MDQWVGLDGLVVAIQIQIEPVTGRVVGNPAQWVEVTLQMNGRLGENEGHSAFNAGRVEEKARCGLEITQAH